MTQTRLPRMPSAVIFDMDGLLFDTECLYRDAILAAGAEAGLDVDAALIDRTTGCTWDETRRMLLAHFGAAFPVDRFIAAWLRHFEGLAASRLALKPGALELLDALDALSLRRGIATSSGHERVRHHLATHGLTGRFSVIVGDGDYAFGKPAPDPFLTAAGRLGVEPRLCLALEDSHNGIRSAAAAGMMAVMVPDLLTPTDEIRALCTLVAGDLHEVRRLVLEASRAGTAPP